MSCFAWPQRLIFVFFKLIYHLHDRYHRWFLEKKHPLLGMNNSVVYCRENSRLASIVRARNLSKLYNMRNTVLVLLCTLHRSDISLWRFLKVYIRCIRMVEWWYLPSVPVDVASKEADAWSYCKYPLKLNEFLILCANWPKAYIDRFLY